MANININGKSFQGDNISVNGSRILIDGKSVYDGEEESKLGPISINVEGEIDSLDVPVVEELNVYGNVNDLETMNGNVAVEGDIFGDVETFNGNVKARTIKGDVETFNGDVTMGNHVENVETVNGTIIKETLKQKIINYAKSYNKSYHN